MTAGDAEMFVTDNPQMRPIEGALALPPLFSVFTSLSFVLISVCLFACVSVSAGAAPYTTAGTDAPPTHKTIIIMLPSDPAPARSFQIGVRGNADSSSDTVAFSVTARTQPTVTPTPLSLGQNTTHADMHTMPGFYVFSVDAVDADLNVTLSSNSSRGAHFFASTDYKYPSFARHVVVCCLAIRLLS